jgi:hypothetical protein
LFDLEKEQIESIVIYSNDDDFIKVGLGGMGYNHRSYQKTIPNCKFIRGQFQTRILKK